eukprot:jgi/Ulvmu1/11057/UM007_0239.1
MVQDDSDDEVVAEIPVYASNEKSLFGSHTAPEERIRLVNVHYPLRAPIRPYNTSELKDVLYKRDHRVLTMKVPEDRPGMDNVKHIPLSGVGLVPEVPLCAMVKVDGSCILVPIDEVTRMRPDMSAFVQDSVAREEVAEAALTDPDYKPKAKGKKSDTKATAKAVKVEVQKRETERQALMRTRSYTHHREQLAAEEAIKLKPSTNESINILTRGCSKVLQSHPGEVAMGVSRKEYLRHSSPAFWVTRRPQQASAATSATVASGAAAAPEPPPPLSDESKKALEVALGDLFEDQPVVTMRDVRVWLQTYTANAKARVAALHTDTTLSDLLTGGGSVIHIRGRYIVAQQDDPVRVETLKLLQARPEGLRKADVAAALKAAGVQVSDHAISRSLRSLCVAAGAVWHLKEGATFSKPP